jgi:site-specific recombinase XerD
MYTILMGYLSQLPGAMQEKVLPSGEKAQVCVYSPHSLRATTATLLLDAGERIESVQDLLDHKHITTTQIYDKRRRSVRDSASHKVPI